MRHPKEGERRLGERSKSKGRSAREPLFDTSDLSKRTLDMVRTGKKGNLARVPD